MILNRLLDTLIKHEGLKLKPYHDTVGKLTIGIGRNLDDNGISKDEALTLLENDLKVCEIDAREVFGAQWDKLNDVRQEVILNMLFNLGRPRFLGFKKCLAAIKDDRWADAAAEMQDSRWAVQVGNRAKELAAAMETDKWDED